MTLFQSKSWTIVKPWCSPANGQSCNQSRRSDRQSVALQADKPDSDSFHLPLTPRLQRGPAHGQPGQRIAWWIRDGQRWYEPVLLRDEHHEDVPECASKMMASHFPEQVSRIQWGAGRQD